VLVNFNKIHTNIEYKLDATSKELVKVYTLRFINEPIFKNSTISVELTRN